MTLHPPSFRFKYLLATLVAWLLCWSTSALADGRLENPGRDSFQSGIAVISGWHCDANFIELQFNNQEVQRASYGSPRNDTEDLCGDTDNGFGFLYNMSLLGEGEHTLTAYADGVKFDEVTFTVTKPSPQEFLRGAEGQTRIKGFPDPSTDLILKWQQPNQNFVIAGKEASSNPYDIDGIWDAGYSWVSIHTRPAGDHSEIIAILNEKNGEFAEVYEGYIQGTAGQLRTVSGGSTVNSTLSFQVLSQSRIRVRVDSCTPRTYGSYCLFNAGDVVSMTRFF